MTTEPLPGRFESLRWTLAHWRGRINEMRAAAHFDDDGYMTSLHPRDRTVAGIVRRAEAFDPLDPARNVRP